MAEDNGHQVEEPHLQRSLKNRHIQLIAIGGAIGTGLFMGSGRTVSYAGPSLLLIYLLIGVMLFIMMRAMGELLLHDLNYKSFQDFAGDLLGPWAGFFAGWTYWILWVVTATAEIIVIAGYFDFWIHDLRWSMVATLGLVLALLACNLLTVKLFGEIEFWFALIKIIAIVVLIVVGLVLVVTGFTSPDGTVASVTYLWDRGGVFPTGLDGFLKAFQIAVFAFIGIELIGTAAAETSDPRTTLPRAINAIPVRIVVFYVLTLAVIMTVTPWDKVDPDVSPFVNLFSLVGFAAAAGVMNFVVLTSASSSANSGIFSTSRMLYGLSQHGQAPKSFSTLSSHNIPARALYMSVGLTLIAFPILILGESVMAAFETVSTVSVGLVLFIWSLILVCYIKYRRDHPEAHAKAAFKVPGAAFTPWVVLAFFVFVVYVLLSYDDTRTALLLTLVWFVGLTIAWFVRSRLASAQPRRQA
ncbi:amino acid permease [Arachnia propionica]|uniref:Amino acid permease n=1 Tax=Arachnia propionica TaxID=1750 RepID=A0A3P1T0W8_9ACTN|nr:amino acid permease [Arachnia propionica]RRD03137.1 amino acid permease [Arachnia propionica]